MSRWRIPNMTPVDISKVKVIMGCTFFFSWALSIFCSSDLSVQTSQFICTRNILLYHLLDIEEYWSKSYILITYFSINNYTKVAGLQLDQPPVIGSLHVKEVIIERNDNAEGTIEFTNEGVNFLGMFPICLGTSNCSFY